MGRTAWTAKEDAILSEYIRIHGEGGWRSLPQKAGLKRSGKSCRLRWLNYLRLDIRRGNISPQEEELIIRLHRLLGNRWSLIAGRLPGRTDNEIKNYWNTHLSKRRPHNQALPKKAQRTSKPVPPAGNHILRTPRSAKDSNKCENSEKSSHEDLRWTSVMETMNNSNSCCEIFVGESIRDHDFELKENIAEPESLSMKISGYSSSSMSNLIENEVNTPDNLLYLNRLSSSSSYSALLSSPYNSLEDFRIEEFESWPSNVSDQKYCMDGSLNQRYEMSDELQYLQKSSSLLLPEDWEWE